MNVVIRGLMAAAMAVYATLHLLQALSPPEGSPGWLVAAFAGSAVVALVLAGGLIVDAQRREARWEHAAALLAARFATRATREVSETVPTRPPSEAKTGADPSGD